MHAPSNNGTKQSDLVVACAISHLLCNKKRISHFLLVTHHQFEEDDNDRLELLVDIQLIYFDEFGESSTAV